MPRRLVHIPLLNNIEMPSRFETFTPIDRAPPRSLTALIPSSEGLDVTSRSGGGKRGRDDPLSPGTADFNGRAAKQSCWRGVGNFFVHCRNFAVASRSSSLPPTTVKNGNNEISDQLSLPLSRRRYSDQGGGDEDSRTSHDHEERHKYLSNSRLSAALALDDRGSRGCNRSCELLSEPHSKERSDTRALVPYDGRRVENKTKPTYSTKGTNTDTYETGNDRSRGIVGGGDQSDENEWSWTGLCQCGRYLFVMGGKSWTGTCSCGRTAHLPEASTAITTRERWTCQACHAWNSNMDAHECDMCCQGRDVDVKPPVKNDTNMRIVKMFPVPLSKAVERSVPALKPTQSIFAAAAVEPVAPSKERAGAMGNSSDANATPNSDITIKTACGQICTSASVSSTRHPGTLATPTTSPIASFTFGPSSSHGVTTDVLHSSVDTPPATPAPVSASSTAAGGGGGVHGLVAAAGPCPQEIVESTTASENSVSDSEKLSHRITEEGSSRKNAPEGDVVAIGSTTPAESVTTTVATTAAKTTPVPAAAVVEFVAAAALTVTMSARDNSVNVSSTTGHPVLPTKAASPAAAAGATPTVRPVAAAGPSLLGTDSVRPVSPIAVPTTTASTFVFGARPSVAPVAPLTAAVAAVSGTSPVVGPTVAKNVAVSAAPVARGDVLAPSTLPMLSSSKTSGPTSSSAATGVRAKPKRKIQSLNTLRSGGAGGDRGTLSSSNDGNNNPPGTSGQAVGSTSTPNSFHNTLPNWFSGGAIGLPGSRMQVSTTPTGASQHAQGNVHFNFFGSVVGRGTKLGAPQVHAAHVSGVLQEGTTAAPATTAQASGLAGPVQAPGFGASPTSTVHPFFQSFSSTLPAPAAVSQAPGFSFGSAAGRGLASAPANAPVPGVPLPQGGGSLAGFSVGSTNRQRGGGGKVGRRRIVRGCRPKQ